ncbi:MAG TPA: MMPL family transporter [Nocardioides sp.]|uniref:MMPL family transporter n=1 Tax=Nocardioides sp. TaxID=35761 RepID=UPI002E35A251|nr:MMPL family transporter [Nocardioides sp.]HEX3929097.1 MMPL family transporter [Nocardioides sp.]
MFPALGRLATRHPWYVVIAWIVASVLIVLTAPKLSSTADQSEFLPSKYESIRASNLQTEAFPQQNAVGALVVFDRTDGAALTAADLGTVKKVVAELDAKVPAVFSGVVAQPPSQNKLVQIAVAGIGKDKNPYEPDAIDGAKQLRADAHADVRGTDLTVGLTGAAAQALDSQDASSKAEAIVGLTTLGLILLLMVVIFRSVILALFPLLVIGLVSQVAVGLIGAANKAFDLKTDSSIQVILIVVLFGIGTDYILFFLFRYRERLRLGEDHKVAVAQAIQRAGEAIMSAGGAVIVSFMALILSSLGIFKSIGPALAIAVAVTVVAALTLVPAVVSLLGTRVFWPSRAWKKEPTYARFGAIGRSLGRRPGTYAAASGILLAVLAIFALQFNPNFDLGDSGAPKTVESSVALKTLEKGFPPGATDPTVVLLHSTDGKPLDSTETATFATELGKADGVGSVAPAQLSPDRQTASYSVVLDADPTSDAALDAIKGPVRDAAHANAPPGTEALVGGTTSVFADFQKAMNRDYKVVFPVAAIVIAIILALLLRSLVAPWYLMVSVGLGFGATLGAAVIVFQHLQGHSGLIFLLPIYIYLFVVALGTDYNILMIARLREEAREGKDARTAAAEAITHAGPTVAAAGLILAGTFASLMLGGNSLLTALGFSISFGIAVAAFVMAMFFTPAITALIGHAAWWPGHGDERRDPA